MAAIQLDYVSDWFGRLRSRIYTQFRGTVTWEGWVQLLGAQAQDIEDAGQSMFSMLDIDNSAGAQLDFIGRHVVQPRLGADDPTYRLMLKAKARANNSSGTAEDIYAVLTLLLGAIGFVYVPGGRKQFALRVLGVLTPTQVLRALYFVGKSKDAGARGIVEFQESPTAALFMFNTGPGFNAGVFADARQA